MKATGGEHSYICYLLWKNDSKTRYIVNQLHIKTIDYTFSRLFHMKKYFFSPTKKHKNQKTNNMVLSYFSHLIFVCYYT